MIKNATEMRDVGLSICSEDMTPEMEDNAMATTATAGSTTNLIVSERIVSKVTVVSVCTVSKLPHELLHSMSDFILFSRIYKDLDAVGIGIVQGFTSK